MQRFRVGSCCALPNDAVFAADQRRRRPANVRPLIIYYREKSCAKRSVGVLFIIEIFVVVIDKNNNDHATVIIIIIIIIVDYEVRAISTYWRESLFFRVLSFFLPPRHVLHLICPSCERRPPPPSSSPPPRPRPHLYFIFLMPPFFVHSSDSIIIVIIDSQDHFQDGG